MKYKTLTIALAVIAVTYFSGCSGNSTNGSSTPDQNQSDDNNQTTDQNLTDDQNQTLDLSAIDYEAPAQIFTTTTASAVVNNKGAYITSQCYTKTEDDAGKAHNPCFSCHINSSEPNYINDPDIQESYAFSEYTHINRWTNLFEDKTAAVGAISNGEILGYIRNDNYMDANHSIILAETLKHVPNEWDYNNDGLWNGYTPDCYFNFNNEGFDIDPDGNLTGWRAFAYYPFLGTFWPTNGSTDDVLIRLPKIMQQNDAGTFDLTTYKINLAIVEAMIKQHDITIEPVDEALFGVDLNQNGAIDTTTTVVYQWKTPKYDFVTKTFYNYTMNYVGKAKQALIDNTLFIAPGLYPEGTEFLHTVRYIDVDDNGSIKIGTRMKELRYGKKTDWNSYPQLSNASKAEIKEKDDFPDRLRTIRGDSENGLRTGLGWTYQGFIEDKDGHLRPQTYEETLFCIGCHSGIGAIADSTFVFQRKFDHTKTQMGWYHWTQYGFEGVEEPKLADGRYEYQLYLQANGAGDEFRGNDEVKEKFFDANGALIQEEAAKIKDDVTYLLFPSVERALELNKAYRVIVKEQSYIYGRDAHVKPIDTVHRDVAIDTPTKVDVILR